MSGISGRFYLKISANGNLLGEYSNNFSTACSAEAAEREGRTGKTRGKRNFQFLGVYRSFWVEEDGPREAKLTISLNPRGEGIFSLYWEAVNHSQDFEGEGMLCDEILIGNYWSVP